MHFTYKPKGLLPEPFPVLDVIPGLEPMIAFAPEGLLANPSGFLAELARGPDAPVASLIELPYSRIASPQPRLVLARLYVRQI